MLPRLEVDGVPFIVQYILLGYTFKCSPHAVAVPTKRVWLVVVHHSYVLPNRGYLYLYSGRAGLQPLEVELHTGCGGGKGYSSWVLGVGFDERSPRVFASLCRLSAARPVLVGSLLPRMTRSRERVYNRRALLFIALSFASPHDACDVELVIR